MLISDYIEYKGHHNVHEVIINISE